MLEFTVGLIIDTGLQAVGWSVAKVATLGRYRGFQAEDIWFEGTLGFVTLAMAGYSAYRLLSA
jgi:hypothetical protein